MEKANPILTIGTSNLHLDRMARRDSTWKIPPPSPPRRGGAVRPGCRTRRRTISSTSSYRQRKSELFNTPEEPTAPIEPTTQGQLTKWVWILEADNSPTSEPYEVTVEAAPASKLPDDRPKADNGSSAAVPPRGPLADKPPDDRPKVGNGASAAAAAVLPHGSLAGRKPALNNRKPTDTERKRDKIRCWKKTIDYYKAVIALHLTQFSQVLEHERRLYLCMKEGAKRIPPKSAIIRCSSSRVLRHQLFATRYRVFLSTRWGPARPVVHRINSASHRA
ncbi:unnamed protein product [Vitrella brassicaformis CCMP3155]|uniref:Uncharacterized protein n=1 Tax=Vitrella brassicaformis (strain CCMP3155) TaxID=1169540 RepID=A0A0G4EMI3_VITBC|nr:unnamed protein product [Vitrella brassicaformis CCMP3155]|eukprot:CEL98184.1 unnamed protein product [Vitrella brassicaformis CCMP3155]